jgi:uncharacterized protein DUF5127
VTWSTASTFQSVFETVQLQNQRSFTENAHGQAEWGQLYFATARVRFPSWESYHDFELVIYVEQSDAVTFGVGSVDSLIGTFSNRGSLHNVPVAGSLEEGLSELVRSSGITTSF